MGIYLTLPNWTRTTLWGRRTSQHMWTPKYSASMTTKSKPPNQTTPNHQTKSPSLQRRYWKGKIVTSRYKRIKVKSVKSNRRSLWWWVSDGSRERSKGIRIYLMRKSKKMSSKRSICLRGNRINNINPPRNRRTYRKSRKLTKYNKINTTNPKLIQLTNSHSVTLTTKKLYHSEAKGIVMLSRVIVM